MTATAPTEPFDFGEHTQPFGVGSIGDAPPRVVVAYRDGIVDLYELLRDDVFAQPSLNGFLARGPQFWTDARRAIAATIETAPRIAPADVRLHLPIEVADYVDFYSSLEHATNVGRILRPGGRELAPNWRELPVGYHGRSGTVVVSGTDIRRPHGQLQAGDDRPRYAPSERLDPEVELGLIVGVPSRLGTALDISQFAEHVFGLVILIDWSARDVQAWEGQPLGPFLSKSFATTISPWVVPLAALEGARVDGPPRDPEPLPYLREPSSWGLDIELDLSVNGQLVSRPQFAAMYWTVAQQFAHLVSNGSSLRTGDLYGTGTISSFDQAAMGSLIELTRNGAEALTLADGTQLAYLRDGDLVTVSARARAGSTVFELGTASGRITPAG